MTKHVVVGKDHIFGPWITERLAGGRWFEGRGSTIGLYDDHQEFILAACLFEAFNGASVLLHCAGEGRDWLNREFLWFVFFYPFEQLKVHKIISPVSSSNAACIRFIKHIGFTLEATLESCDPNGNLDLWTMTRDQCKWLDLRGKYRGEAQGSDST